MPSGHHFVATSLRPIGRGACSFARLEPYLISTLLGSALPELVDRQQTDKLSSLFNGLRRENGATFDRLFLKLDSIKKFRSDTKR
jgi:hypothetical protein